MKLSELRVGDHVLYLGDCGFSHRLTVTSIAADPGGDPGVRLVGFEPDEHGVFDEDAPETVGPRGLASNEWIEQVDSYRCFSIVPDTEANRAALFKERAEFGLTGNYYAWASPDAPDRWARPDPGA